MAASGLTENRLPTNPSPEAAETDAATIEDAVGQCLGQWNRLVSATNWEKGRIICQWRTALIDAGVAVGEYSDEAWAQKVGGVTSQHVGRLRRVYDRFGAVHQQYDGLYWSHFQAAIDWEDAEMWLEGAIQNGWSVSQMRGRRWETVGAPGESMPDEPAAEMDEDAPAVDDAPAEASAATAALKSIDSPSAEAESTGDDSTGPAEREVPSTSDSDAQQPPTKPSRKRLSVEVDDLPDDLADAFEQFKLAIIAHRTTRWDDATPETVVECLDALRELTLAPLD